MNGFTAKIKGILLVTALVALPAQAATLLCQLSEGQKSPLASFRLDTDLITLSLRSGQSYQPLLMSVDSLQKSLSILSAPLPQGFVKGWKEAALFVTLNTENADAPRAKLRIAVRNDSRLDPYVTAQNKFDWDFVCSYESLLAN